MYVQLLLELFNDSTMFANSSSLELATSLRFDNGEI